MRPLTDPVLENQIPSDAKVYLEGNPLILDMLKAKKENVLENLEESTYNVKNDKFTIYFIYDQKKNIQKEKTGLETSIQRR